MRKQIGLVDLLRECADALYYVYENGDSRVFHNGKYEELALRCDEMKKQFQAILEKHEKTLEKDHGVCYDCIYDSDCSYEFNYECPAYKILMEFRKTINLEVKEE